jgi:hypothetical protein
VIAFLRHCERNEAIQRATKRKDGLLRRFAPRNDDQRKTIALAALGVTR